MDPLATTASVVIPVRYVARGVVVQTTSTHLTPEFIRVRSSNPPTAGMTVPLQLYLPGGAQPLEIEGTVRHASFGTNASFTAELVRIVGLARGRIDAFLATMDGKRACSRVEVSLPVLLRDAFSAGGGTIVNLSASGLFVQTDLGHGVGARVRGELQLPGAPQAQEFEAEVVRVAEQPKGVGLQLVGGTDEFRETLRTFLEARA